MHKLEICGCGRGHAWCRLGVSKGTRRFNVAMPNLEGCMYAWRECGTTVCLHCRESSLDPHYTYMQYMCTSCILSQKYLDAMHSILDMYMYV